MLAPFSPTEYFSCVYALTGRFFHSQTQARTNQPNAPELCCNLREVRTKLSGSGHPAFSVLVVGGRVSSRMNEPTRQRSASCFPPLLPRDAALTLLPL